jgi:hypothetical protein
LRSPAYDDTVSALRRVLNYTSGDPENGFAIDEIELGRIDATLVTSAQERFEKSVIEWISSFLSDFDRGLGTISEPCNLLSQQLVPHLPAEMLGHQSSDFAAAASVFAFNGNDFYHTI